MIFQHHGFEVPETDAVSRQLSRKPSRATSGQMGAGMQHDQARRTSIAIVVGGIGGLTAAACLLRAGFDVHVYEQTSRLSEVGAGINIGPNASRILHRLGIVEELKKRALSPRASISGAGMTGGSYSVLR